MVDDAADLAHAYENNGLTDWYLPALDELAEMYDAIGQGADNAGNFSPDIYWSSTEDGDHSPGNVWAVQFGAGGSIHTTSKAFTQMVRAVRIFDNTPEPE